MVVRGGGLYGPAQVERLVGSRRLPPKKLPEYYQHFDLNRLAKKMIFGTDWPGVPGTAANVSAIAGLGLPAETWMPFWRKTHCESSAASAM